MKAFIVPARFEFPAPQSLEEVKIKLKVQGGFDLPKIGEFILIVSSNKKQAVMTIKSMEVLPVNEPLTERSFFVVYLKVARPFTENEELKSYVSVI